MDQSDVFLQKHPDQMLLWANQTTQRRFVAVY
jgi:hypothetical protein